MKAIILMMSLCFAASVSAQPGDVKTVVAVANDTVASIAQRNNVDPIETAKLNGLLPNSKLAAGRQIRLPIQAVLASPVPKVLATPIPKVLATPFSCARSSSDLPDIRGMRLGMSKTNVGALVKPAFVPDVERGGIILTEGFREPSNDISTVRVEFNNDKLLSFSIRYHESDAWKNDAELLELIEEKLQLPKSYYSETVFEGLAITCRDFRLSVYMNELKLTDLPAEKLKAEEVKAEIERKKKAFKP